MSLDVQAKALELKERAEARANAERSVEDAARNRDAREALVRAQIAAAGISKSVEATRSSGIAAGPLPEEAARAGELAAVLADKLTEAETNELQDLAHSAERDVTQLVAEIQRDLAAQVEKWAGQQPRPTEDFLRVLEASAANEVQATREALSLFREHAEPQAPDEVHELAAAAKELEDSYQRLVAKTPDEVRHFLETAPTGIQLSEISDGVLDWLRQHRADEAFVVRLR